MEEQIVYVAALSGGRVMGLTCEDISSVTRGAKIIELALYPATLAITLSPMKAQLIASLAELGLTMANPAVLGATIIGATGVVVVYLILREKIEECSRMDRQQLKESILRELERKYGVNGNGVELKISR
jgi:hypothetical protein